MPLVHIICKFEFLINFGIDYLINKFAIVRCDFGYDKYGEYAYCSGYEGHELDTYYQNVRNYFGLGCILTWSRQYPFCEGPTRSHRAK